MQNTNTTIRKRWEFTSKVFAWLVMAIGMVGWSGWIFDSYRLRSLLSAGATMKFNTALCLVLAAGSLLSLSYKQRVAARVGFSVVFLICLLTLAEHLWKVDFSIDQLFFPDPDTLPPDAPGRISLLTSISLSVLAVAMLLLSYGRYSLGQLLASLVFVFAYAALLGYIFSESGYYSIPTYSTMAVHTAAALLLLASGLLVCMPHRGLMQILSSSFVGGVLARYTLGYFLAMAPFFIAFYLYQVEQRQLSPVSGVIAMLLAAAVISIPQAYLLLRRIDNLDARLQHTNQELKEANSQLLLRNQELSGLTEELTQSTEALARQNQELERINEDLDNLVYIASHDLKAPVSNMEGVFGNMRASMKAQLSQEETRLLRILQESMERLKMTIEDLTRIVKAQKAGSERKELLSIEGIVQSVQHELEQDITRSGAHIRMQLEVSTLYFSRFHLRSILYNLLSNAIKYRAPQRSPLVTIISQLAKEGVILIVEDNGLGIGATKLPQLFSIFRRFHSHVQGSGIGLYLVKRIVEGSGGTVQVESREDAGTRFTIFLPNQALT